MAIAATDFLAPLLTPHGQLLLVPDADAPSLPAALAQRLTDAFALGSGHGLLHLGAAEVGSILPSPWAWWRDFATRYVTALCATPEGDAIATPDNRALDALIADAPPMTGVEYLTTEVLTTLWSDLGTDDTNFGMPLCGRDVAFAREIFKASQKDRLRRAAFVHQATPQCGSRQAASAE